MSGFNSPKQANGGYVTGIVTPQPSAAERSAALMAQAQSFANEAVDVVLRNMLELQADCRQLVELQSIPPGVREHLKQLADQLADRAQGIKILRERR